VVIVKFLELSNESFAPVINDISFHIMLVSKLIWNLNACIIDIETAFLHGDLQEEIYMNIPEGLNSNPDDEIFVIKLEDSQSCSKLPPNCLDKLLQPCP
jgi:Reverse transcriptase (RNA-dependent DNA polymerase)